MTMTAATTPRATLIHIFESDDIAYRSAGSRHGKTINQHSVRFDISMRLLSTSGDFLDDWVLQGRAFIGMSAIDGQRWRIERRILCWSGHHG